MKYRNGHHLGLELKKYGILSRVGETKKSTIFRFQILLLLADERLITQSPFENMENNEYLFWNGFRLTLTIPPKFALSLNEDKMDNSIKKLNPCLYISLWRSSRPRDYVDIPTPKATKIIGLDTALKVCRSNRTTMPKDHQVL